MTTTTTLKFKSFKGGEFRATEGGDTYRVRKLDADTWAAEVKVAGATNWEPLGAGSTKDEAAMVADTFATAPVVSRPESRAPRMVQQGDTDETVEQVLASIPDPDRDAEIAEAVKQGVTEEPTTGPKARAKANGKTKRAAKKASKQAKGAKGVTVKGGSLPAHVAGQPLEFVPWRGDDNELRAKGADHLAFPHVYRILVQDTGVYAQQRRRKDFYHIAGRCDTMEQAMHLCELFEAGNRELSHQKMFGVHYAAALNTIGADPAKD